MPIPWTLRYLLAYMHGDLSPEDTQEMAKRVEESEQAKRLLHRIRDVTGRIRLGAPTVSDRGQWLDPNTVAEYLDNKLPHGQVPDFERVCRETDVQLAEVASCHQILSIVLREPAEVDPISRQRMYRIPQTLAAEAGPTETADSAEPEDAASASAGSNGSAHQTAEEAPAPASIANGRPRPAARSSGMRTAVGLAVALAIVLLVLALVDQFQPGTYLGGLFNRDSGRERDTWNPPSGDPRSTADRQRDPGPAGPPDDRRDTAPPREPTSALPKRDPDRPLDQGEPGANPRDVKTEPNPPTAILRPSPAEPEIVPKPAIVPPVRPRPEGPKETPKDEPGRMKPGEPPVTMEGPGLKQPPGALEPSTRLPSGDPGRRPGAVASPKPPAPVERLGTFTSPNEVLLRLDAKTGSWVRLREESPINANDRLLSLPAFRPVVSLGAHVHVRLIDGARAAFISGGTQGIPGVVVDYGRLVIWPADGAKPRIRLQVGERLGTITFSDADSALAIDVGHTEKPSADPGFQAGPVVADLYATTGKMIWDEEPGGKPVTLTAPIRATLTDQSLDTVALQQFPRWVFDTKLGTLEQQVAATIDRALAVEEPVNVGLRELAQHRKKEVRAVAYRSLSYIEDFGPLLALLNDSDQRLQWTDYIDELRAAINRGPHEAVQLKAVLEKLYGDDGTNLYEMFWKYRAEGLTPADSRQLVKYLDHDTLIFRVVSFWNLKSITGLGLHYRPEDPANKRQSAIQAWRERLRSSPTLQIRPGTGEEKGEKAEKPASLVPAR